MLVWLTSHATPRKKHHMVTSVKVSWSWTSRLVVESCKVDGTSDDHLQQLETCDRHGEAGWDLDPAQVVSTGGQTWCNIFDDLKMCFGKRFFYHNIVS